MCCNYVLRQCTAFSFAEQGGGSHPPYLLEMQGGSQHEHKCNHWTLLHVCTQLGWEASVKYLLEAGAEVNSKLLVLFIADPFLLHIKRREVRGKR